MKNLRPVPKPEINTARCTGCGWCVPTCNLHLLSLENLGWKKFSVLSDIDACTGCKKCAVRCPFDAITMRELQG
ncbi:ATP-binding protein [Rhodoferax sp.]|uniref:ATP-binding protein n=1 Tax=Rhodoferax sp. TaxID=50421 RepID=UPI00374DCCC5